MGRFTDLIPLVESTPLETPVLDPAADKRMSVAKPDAYAEALRLAPTGLPPTVITANLEEIKNREEAAKFRAFLAATPEAQRLGDDFNATAKDDVDTLDRIRIAGKNIGAGLLNLGAGGVLGTMAAVEEQFASVAGYVGLGPSSSLRNLPKEDPRRVESRFTETADVFLELQKKVGAQADKLTAENEKVGVFAQGVYSGLQSLSVNAPMLLAGLAAKNPQLALAGMTSLVFGDEYGTGREAGLTHGQSMLYGGTHALVEGVTEKIGVGMLFGDIAAKTGLFKTLAKQFAAEIPGEQVATILQDFTEFATLRPEATLEQYLAERPDAAVQTLISTIVASGIQGAAVHTIGTRMSFEAQQAEAREGFLKELGSLAEASKLRERSPEQFKRYVESVAGDTDIYLDSADAVKLLQSEHEVELDEDLEARIAESAENDVPLRITAAEYATYFADGHTAQVLSSRARVGSPVAMNAEEAKNIESEFAARAEQAIVESQNEEAAREDARKINDSVKAQILSSGRFRSDVASQYATLVENFFVTMANRSGMTASQLFEQYPLRIQAAPTDAAADATLDQLPPEAFSVESRRREHRAVPHQRVGGR
jgi:hypothetical protein